MSTTVVSSGVEKNQGTGRSAAIRRPRVISLLRLTRTP